MLEVYTPRADRELPSDQFPRVDGKADDLANS